MGQNGLGEVAAHNDGPLLAVFSFLYLKKLKFQKYMSVLENSKIYPGRPPIGRQAQSVIFFLQIYNEVPVEKKGGPVAPPTGDRGLSPTPGRPLRGRQGPLPFYNPWPPYADIPFVI